MGDPTTRILRSHTRALAQTPPPSTLSNTKIGKSAKPTKRRKRLDPWYPKRKVPKTLKRKHAPPQPHFTCRICISRLPSAAFIRWTPPRRARYSRDLDAPVACIPHLARNPSRRHIDPVCKTCVGAFMAARLDTLGARRVSVGCVEAGCETVWPWEMVVKYFPVEKLEAFNLAAFEVWRADAELFTCLRTTCGAVGVRDESAPGYPQVACGECGYRSCANCVMAWHLDQTCAEVSAAAVDAQMSETEKETLGLMQSKDGKRCPNCQLVIEKDGGCPSMFCPCCKKYFNWQAAASAVPGAKKALPVSSSYEYWQTPGTVVCEADRLEGEVPGIAESTRTDGRGLDGDALADFDFTRFLGIAQPVVVGAPPMPLPNEDVRDL